MRCWTKPSMTRPSVIETQERQTPSKAYLWFLVYSCCLGWKANRKAPGRLLRLPAPRETSPCLFISALREECLSGGQELTNLKPRARCVCNKSEALNARKAVTNVQCKRRHWISNANHPAKAKATNLENLDLIEVLESLGEEAPGKGLRDFEKKTTCL